MPQIGEPGSFFVGKGPGNMVLSGCRFALQSLKRHRPSGPSNESENPGRSERTGLQLLIPKGGLPLPESKAKNASTVRAKRAKPFPISRLERHTMSEAVAPSPEQTENPPSTPPQPAQSVTADQLVRSDNASPEPAPAAPEPAQGADGPKSLEQRIKEWKEGGYKGRKPGSKNQPKAVPGPGGKEVPQTLLDLPAPNVSAAQLGGPGATAQPQPAEPAEPVQPVGPDQHRQSAEATFDGLVLLATMLIGPEWQPRKIKVPGAQPIDEREPVVVAIEKYYRTKNMPDLPPGLALLMAVGIYSAARLREQNTQTKLKIAYLKAKDFLGGLWSRLFKRRGVGVVRVLSKEEQQAQGQP